MHQYLFYLIGTNKQTERFQHFVLDNQHALADKMFDMF